LGMGNLSSGLWIGPRRILPDVVETVGALCFGDYVDVFTARYEGLGDVAELVHHSWDLAAIAELYTQFIRHHRPVLAALEQRRKPPAHAEAFVSYTSALHEWRKFPYLDPGLPVEVLPTVWPGRTAARLFGDLRSRLEPAAFEFASSVVERLKPEVECAEEPRAPARLPPVAVSFTQPGTSYPS